MIYITYFFFQPKRGGNKVVHQVEIYPGVGMGYAEGMSAHGGATRWSPRCTVYGCTYFWPRYNDPGTCFVYPRIAHRILSSTIKYSLGRKMSSCVQESSRVSGRPLHLDGVSIAMCLVVVSTRLRGRPPNLCKSSAPWQCES